MPGIFQREEPFMSFSLITLETPSFARLSQPLPPYNTFGFFMIRKLDAFLSGYMTDLKLHRTQ